MFGEQPLKSRRWTNALFQERKKKKNRTWSSRLVDHFPQKKNEWVGSTMQVQKVPWHSIRIERNEMSSPGLESTKSIQLKKGRQLPQTCSQARLENLEQHPITIKWVKDPTFKWKHSVVNFRVVQSLMIPRVDIKVMSLWTNVPAQSSPIRRRHTLKRRYSDVTLNQWCETMPRSGVLKPLTAQWHWSPIKAFPFYPTAIQLWS